MTAPTSRVVLLTLFTLVGACAYQPPAATPATKKADRATLRAELAAQRKLQLQRLHDYAAAGLFPKNRLDDHDKINVFIDEDGAICAVANLMVKGGAVDLVKQTADTQNTIRLVDVTDGPLLDWML